MIMVWNQMGNENRKAMVFVVQSKTTCFSCVVTWNVNLTDTPNHIEQMLNKNWTYLHPAKILIYFSRVPSHQWHGAVLLRCRPCPMHCDPRPIWIQPCVDLQGATGVGINVSSMLGQNNCNPQLSGKLTAKHLYVNGYHNLSVSKPLVPRNCSCICKLKWCEGTHSWMLNVEASCRWTHTFNRWGELWPELQAVGLAHTRVKLRMFGPHWKFT